MQHLELRFTAVETPLKNDPALKFSTCSSREEPPLIKRSNPPYCPRAALPPLVPQWCLPSIVPLDNFLQHRPDINGPCLFLHYLSCRYRRPLSLRPCLRGETSKHSRVSRRCRRSQARHVTTRLHCERVCVCDAGTVRLTHTRSLPPLCVVAAQITD